MRITLNLSSHPASEDPASRSEARHLIDMLRETADYFFVPAAAELARNVAEQIEAQIPIPKPEEPQGLGAVVATESDGDYIRVSTELTNPWLNVQTGVQRHYDGVAAIRVLSEGVS